MIEAELEKYIKNLFENLSRKTTVRGNKREVWLRIHNHIVHAGSEAKQLEKHHFLNLFLLRNSWGKAFAFILMVAIAVSLVGGVARATPGETLYPVKKAAEKMEIALASSEKTKIKITIKHAKRRLQEVQILVAENKENDIVQATLEELTNATTNAVAATETNPELREDLVNLANHEEEVLGNVQRQAQGDVRDTVSKALLITKESLDKLNSNDKVKGAIATPLPETENAKATSTAPETVKPSAAGKPAPPPKEAVIESEIQIDGVIKISDGQSIPVSP